MLTRRPRLSRKSREELFDRFVAGNKPADTYKYFENKDKKFFKKHGKYPKKLSRINLHTILTYFNSFRECIYIHNRKAPRFNGEVEIDETMFGGRKRKKRLDNYGDPDFYKTQGTRSVKIKKYKPARKILVMGILKRGGNVYTHIIEKRDANTLIPIIHMVVDSGTTIYTDEWSSYNLLPFDGYIHIKINHTKKFANRKGEHVNTLERFWGFAKDLVKPYKGGYRHNFPMHLKEAEFRWNIGNEDLYPALHDLVIRYNPLLLK